MTRGLILLSLFLSIGVQPLVCCAADNRPNILWITIEDWSPDLSCYGTSGIRTPNVDRLAAEGIRYEQAFATSPVCSTSRSAMMTGFYQDYIGSHQHRESRKRPLPNGVKPIPHLMAEAGYFTALMSQKVDVNFLPDKRSELFQGTDWNQRKKGQPFFARITYAETHRPWKRDSLRPIDITQVSVPPQYADTPFIRRDIANGYESMQIVDRKVGKLLDRLQKEGLAENTVVFFISDHGVCQVRGKQFLYDEGIRVPMIVRWPKRIRPGQVSRELVSTLDVCATALKLAGVKSGTHGVDLFGPDIKKRQYLFSTRGRMGNTHDAMRAIRSRKYKLILNLMPERAWCQFSGYKETAYPVLAEMNLLYLRGQLAPRQSAFFASQKPQIELYDVTKDPDELNNLANQNEYLSVQKTLITELEKWRNDVIHDPGIDNAFRGRVFGKKPDGKTVAEWIHNYKDKIDFNKHGYPGWYPTRSETDWEKVRNQWEPWVFRSPDSKMKRPKIGMLP